MDISTLVVVYEEIDKLIKQYNEHPTFQNLSIASGLEELKRNLEAIQENFLKEMGEFYESEQNT